MLGNVEPALHAHVIPRYEWESPATRVQPVWLHDWSAARSFDAATDREMQQQLRGWLEHRRG